ncbi:MAG: GNAT family N-acetyltransferase [Notoacmeibacter sp.]
MSALKNAYVVYPATADRWTDLEAVMGPKGGSGGCWCMLWRISRKDYEEGKAERNREMLKKCAHSKVPPGLLAYHNEKPVGWCSVTLRSELPALEKSWVLKPIDATPVWSISCFVIVKGYRRKGVSLALLNAASDFVAAQGGSVLEGYPIETAREDYPAVYAWTGLASTFIKAGFKEAIRHSPTRPIMRKYL